jgi:hypothetical protein
MAESPILIEKGIPVPPETRGIKPTMYPWAQMEVGDSFFLPGRKAHPGFTSKPCKATRHKFTSRKVNGGFRTWRVK